MGENRFTFSRFITLLQYNLQPKSAALSDRSALHFLAGVYTFETLYNTVHDNASKRKLILAMGRAKKDHWFHMMRRGIADLNPWQKRAFIAAYSCVPRVVAIHFYRSLRSGADMLEESVIKWAMDQPF